VETLALGIFFRGLAASGVERVLTDLLAYIELDESPHVALRVLYLPKAARVRDADRAREELGVQCRALPLDARGRSIPR
jgi:hypothetical protein